jgi:hypothetical protein
MCRCMCAPKVLQPGVIKAGLEHRDSKLKKYMNYITCGFEYMDISIHKNPNTHTYRHMHAVMHLKIKLPCANVYTCMFLCGW